jgi:hypothetical protein
MYKFGANELSIMRALDRAISHPRAQLRPRTRQGEEVRPLGRAHEVELAVAVRAVSFEHLGGDEPEFPIVLSTMSASAISRTLSGP